MDGGSGDDHLDRRATATTRASAGSATTRCSAARATTTSRATRRPTSSTAATATTSLDGGSGGDDINGGNGNDTIYSDTGPDRIDAGPGDDIIHLNSDPPSAIQSIDCGEGNDTVYNTPAPMGRTNRKLLAAQPNCENVIDLAAERDPTRGITWSGNGTKNGTERNDRLNGQGGSNTLYGARRQRRPLGRRRARQRRRARRQSDFDRRRRRRRHRSTAAAARTASSAATATTTCRATARSPTIFGGNGADNIRIAGKRHDRRRRPRRRHVSAITASGRATVKCGPRQRHRDRLPLQGQPQARQGRQGLREEEEGLGDCRLTGGGTSSRPARTAEPGGPAPSTRDPHADRAHDPPGADASGRQKRRMAGDQQLRPRSPARSAAMTSAGAVRPSRARPRRPGEHRRDGRRARARSRRGTPAAPTPAAPSRRAAPRRRPPPTRPAPARAAPARATSRRRRWPGRSAIRSGSRRSA